jgi:oligopeptide/dipeptide ABC transporter ATP-binding protein
VPEITDLPVAARTPTDGPVLSVRNLETHFAQTEGLVRAVDGASFDLLPAKTLGIVGESGCGKSVTTRSILQILERPGLIVGGEIWLSRPGKPPVDIAKLDPRGREIRSIRGKDIALIFQEPMTSLSAHYTVGNQIGEAIRTHDETADKVAVRKRTLELLNLVGIPRAERRIDEYPFQLSGGLRQRVMIAMALACDPRILIADEPTTALDVTTQAQVLDLLRSLQKERGLSLILITHDMGVIAEMADHVAVMYAGKIVEEAEVTQLFDAPKHPYTQGLLASIPVLGQVRDRLEAIPGSVPNLRNLPPGCRFATRCPHVMDICRTTEPALLMLDDNRTSRCWLYTDQAEGAQHGTTVTPTAG